MENACQHFFIFTSYRRDCMKVIQVSIDQNTYTCKFNETLFYPSLYQSMITWRTVVDEIWKVHLKRKQKVYFLKNEIIGAMRYSSKELYKLDDRLTLHLFDNHHPKDVDEIFPKFKLILNGHWIDQVPDHHLKYIIMNYIYNINDYYHLLQVSKRFKTLLSDYEVWKEIIKQLFVWQGKGKELNEDEQWKQLVFDRCGLPFLSALRMRWTSHRVSKLRTLYGQQNILEKNKIIPNGFETIYGKFRNFFQNSIESYHDVKSKILCVGASHESIVQLINQIYLLIPRSALTHAAFAEVLPLYHEYLPSQSNTIKRSKFIIPKKGHETYSIRPNCAGPTVEMMSYDQRQYTIQRIGDNRLSFMGLTIHSKQFQCHSEYYHDHIELCKDILRQGIGNIIILKYDPMDPESIHHHLRDEYQLIWKSHFENLKVLNRMSSLPLLILVDLSDVSGTSHDQGLFQNIIEPVVQQLHRFMIKLEEETSSTLYSTSFRVIDPWYIQPFHCPVQFSMIHNRTDAVNGFITGMNWLIRCIRKEIM